MTTRQEYLDQIAELTKRVEELKEQERKEQKERRAATPRKWRFSFIPKQPDSFNEVWDITVRLYSLRGQVTNVEECRAAGWSEDELRGGGMTYLYNTLSQNLVMATGGGNIYIVSSKWRWNEPKDEIDEDFQQCYFELSKFLASHPEGGDVTEIITAQRHFKW